MKIRLLFLWSNSPLRLCTDSDHLLFIIKFCLISCVGALCQQFKTKFSDIAKSPRSLEAFALVLQSGEDATMERSRFKETSVASLSRFDSGILVHSFNPTRFWA